MTTAYYVDPTNCANDTGTGLKYTGLTVDSTADTTHITDAGLNGMTIPVGSYVWVAGRSGSLISAWDDGTDTITLGTAISGLTAGDSYYLITPKKTVGAATSLALTAGDIIYVRAGTTDTLSAIINFTSDGTISAYISVIGMGTGSATLETTDGTATEAWHDASTTRPIIDGNNSTYYFNINSDDFWKLENLTITNINTSQSLANIYIYSCSGAFIKNCNVTNNTNLGSNIYIYFSNYVRIEDCTLKDSNFVNINLSYVYLCTILNTVFDGVGNGLGAGTSTAYLDNCRFGTTVQIHDYAFNTSSQSRIHARNCFYNTEIGTAICTGMSYQDILQVFEEDSDQVYGAHKATGYLGSAERVTDVVRSGGGTSSIKILPLSSVTSFRPFILQDFPHPTWRLWCSAGSQTISIYIRGLNWATFPTAAQLYLEAEYVTSDTTEAITRSTVVSDEVLTDNTTWVALQCAVNPHVAGFVNLKLYLGVYEDATTGIYVDIKPVT